jgi:hypothetical protein
VSKVKIPFLTLVEVVVGAIMRSFDWIVLHSDFLRTGQLFFQYCSTGFSAEGSQFGRLLLYGQGRLKSGGGTAMVKGTVP